MTTRDWGDGLETLITLAIRIDNRQLERQRERGGKSLASSSLHPPIQSPAVPQTPLETPLTTEEPMQLGRARLSQQELERRWREGRCLYCGAADHLPIQCPGLQGKARALQGAGRP